MGNTKRGVEGNKKKIIALAVALVLLIGGTYAWLTLTLTGTKTARIEAGTLSLELVDEANEINVENALPVTDDEGKATDPYVFTLNNNGNITSLYTVYLDSAAIDEGLSAMPQNRVKYSVVKTVKTIVGSRDSLNEDGDAADTVVSTETLATDVYNSGAETISSKMLDTGSLASGNYIDYELRLWISSDATNDEMKNTAFAGKLRIEATQEGIENDAAYGETEVTP